MLTHSTSKADGHEDMKTSRLDGFMGVIYYLWA